MGLSERKSWNTENEMRFIDSLGATRRDMMNPYSKMRSRRKCLEGYIESCKHRVVWNKINRDVVLAYAKSALDNLTD